MMQFRRQTGLTLVELMVATTLSLILLAGVLLVFSANKATYQMQNGLGTLQENGRYAIRQIAADLQQTGFGSCRSPNLPSSISMKPRVINVASPSTYSAFLNNYGNGQVLEGRDDVSTTVTLGGKAIALGTDAIEVRGPLRSNINYVAGAVLSTGTIDVLGTGSGFAADEYLLIGDCSGATIFRATTVVEAPSATPPITRITHTTGNTSSSLSQPFGSDALVMEFATHTYFIADTGRNNASGQDILALYRFDGNNSFELVDGVDDMQIEYALDTDANGKIDAFRDAGGVTDWSEVVAARVSLLMNSVEGAGSVEAPYTYFPSGSTAVSPTTGDYRLRQEFSSLISVRNSVF